MFLRDIFLRESTGVYGSLRESTGSLREKSYGKILQELLREKICCETLDLFRGLSNLSMRRSRRDCPDTPQRRLRANREGRTRKFFGGLFRGLSNLSMRRSRWDFMLIWGANAVSLTGNPQAKK